MRYLLFVLLMGFSLIVKAQYSSTPLILSLPMDGDTIQETEPLLVWQSSITDLGSDPRLNLVVTVVQVENGQTPTDAILVNSPVFVRQNLLASSINYSEIDHELEEGVWYAWQVVLFFNNVQVQQSEVFKFIKAEPQEPVQSYYRLRSKIDNSFLELEGDVLYVTTDEHGDFQLNATISGTKIEPRAIQFEETELVDATNQSGGSTQNIESRFFKCNLESLDLKKGKYRIEWKANDTKQFVFFINKK